MSAPRRRAPRADPAARSAVTACSSSADPGADAGAHHLPGRRRRRTRPRWRPTTSRRGRRATTRRCTRRSTPPSQSSIRSSASPSSTPPSPRWPRGPRSPRRPARPHTSRCSPSRDPRTFRRRHRRRRRPAIPRGHIVHRLSPRRRPHQPDPDQPFSPGPSRPSRSRSSSTSSSDRFGDTRPRSRSLTMVNGADGWLRPLEPGASLFPELGADGDAAARPDARRARPDRRRRRHRLGRTREDGARVYPQEALAGQVDRLRQRRDRRGPRDARAEWAIAPATSSGRQRARVRRRGRCCAARPAGRWSPSRADGAGVRPRTRPRWCPARTSRSPSDPTSRRLRRGRADPYAAGAPPRSWIPRTGDVWALASQPAFNPNAMTIGTTLGGVPLTPAGAGQILNKAVLGAYPAGSSFKPFTLAAALKTGVVTPPAPGTCPPTWQYGDFTFRNYMNHPLPGLVVAGARRWRSAATRPTCRSPTRSTSRTRPR